VPSTALADQRKLRGMTRALAVVMLICAASCGRPKKLISVAAGARVVGASAGRVYWVEGNTLTWIDDRLEKPPRFDIRGVDWAESGNFAVDASGIFFSHHNLVTRLEREPAQGEIEGRERSAGQHPSGLLLEGACAYTLDADVDCGDRGAIVALPKTAPAPCVGREVPANGLQPVSFQMDADFFYWIDGSCGLLDSGRPAGTVKMLPRRTNALTVVASGEVGAEDLRVGSGGLYWRTAAGLRFAARGGKPTTVVAGPVTGFVVDGQDLFFTRPDGVYVLADTRADRIVEQRDPKNLVADDRFLYWLSEGGIVRRAR
jgi:hypothetical protein